MSFTQMSRFTNSLTPTVLIPNVYVQSVDAITIPPILSGTGQPSVPAKYNLVFSIVFPDSTTKTISIPFATGSAMNTSLANYETANVTSVS